MTEEANLQPTYEEVLRLKEAGVKNIWVYLADKYGMNKEKIRSWFRSESENRKMQAEKVLGEVDEESTEDIHGEPDEQKFPAEKQTSFDDSGNVKSVISKRVIAMDAEDEKDPNFVLTAHGFEPSKWILQSVINNYWQGMRTKDKGVITLYQSKITVKPKEDSKSITEDDVRVWFDNLGLTKTNESLDFLSFGRLSKRKILLIPLADYHFGDKNYDEHIGEIVDAAKKKVEENEIEEIVVVNMGDILHFDGYDGKTTQGTQVGSRGAYYDGWTEAVGAVIGLLENLSKLAPVHFISINGNHDRVSSFTISNAIMLYFNTNENVSFDVSFEERKYMKYGNSVLGFLHGDMPSKNISSIIQREAKKHYGETDNAYLFMGHYHHIYTQDKDGVIVYQLPSPAFPDEWHQKEGYVGHWQGTHLFVVDKDCGIEEIIYVKS